MLGFQPFDRLLHRTGELLQRGNRLVQRPGLQGRMRLPVVLILEERSRLTGDRIQGSGGGVAMGQ